MSEEEDFREIPDEEVPENLRKKWDREDYESEMLEKNFKPCPHCKKFIEPRSFSCLHCGQRVFWDSGILGKITKSLSQGGLLYFLMLAGIGVIILSFLGF